MATQITGIVGTSASQAVELPTSGSPTTALVTNIGSAVGYVLLGDSSVAVTSGTGLAVLPGASVALTIGANTYLAAIGAGANLNIAVGS
jgi:hypothetical protein